MSEEMGTNGDSPSIMLGGNRYYIDINAWTIDQVKRATGVDVLRCFEDGATLKSLGEAVNFINALRIFTSDDCKRHNTTDDEAFAKLFKNGDIIEQAMDAFKSALIAFFPSHQRIPLQKLMEMEKEAAKRMQDKALDLIQSGRVQGLMDLQLSELDKKFLNAVELLESEIREGVRSES